MNISLEVLMKIKIYAIGKIKDFYKVGCDEYAKRINPYCKIEVIELKDEPINDNPSEAEINKAKDVEGDRVIKLLKPNEYLIGLDLNKKELDSVAFSKYIMQKLESAGSQISFVIGGSYGLSDALKNRVNDSLSLSKCTFLHQMTRLILLEQIYRAFKINNNETYHK